MSVNRGITNSDKLQNLKSSQRTRFGGVNEASMSSLSDNGGGASRTFRRGEMSENTPLESQLTDAKMMNTQLEGANSHLKRRLQDALFELGDNTPTAATPPTTTTTTTTAAAILERERAHQELRNAKTLALLRSKDETINALEARCAEATAEAAQFRSQLQTTAHQLEDVEERVEELIQEKTAQKRKLAEVQAQNEASLLEIAELTVIVENHADTAATVEILSGELAAKSDQVATLTSALEAADEVLEEMQEALKRREVVSVENQQLKSYVVRLLGMDDGEAASQHAVGVLSAHATDRSSSPNDDDEDEQSTMIAALMQANETLENALVAANLRIAGVDRSIHSTPETLLAELNDCAVAAHDHENNRIDPEDQDEIVRLSAEVATLSGKLVVAEESKAHLESVHAVTQQAVLHAESELQAALEREVQLQALETSLAEKVEGEERRANAAKALCIELQEEVDGAAERAQEMIEQLHDLQAQRDALQKRAETAEAAIAEAETAAAAAEAAAGEAKEGAAERVAAALRQSSQLKAQMMAAQTENDALKKSIASLESKLVQAAATAAAKDAAGALTLSSQHRHNVESENTPAVIELARGLSESAAQRIELQRELQVATQMKTVHEQTINHLKSSVARLHAVLSAAQEDSINDGDDEEAVEREEEVQEEKQSDAAMGSLSRLREQIINSLAAQEGQASAFADLLEDAALREETLQGYVQEAQLIEEERQRIEDMCTAAVAVLHGALAQVAMAEGCEEAGDALLHADVDAEELAHVTAAAAAKLKDLAKRLVQERHQQDDEDSSVSLVDALLLSQRDVIAALSSQLAADFAVDSTTALQLHTSTPIDTTSSSRPSHQRATAKGLCALLLHQLTSLQQESDDDAVQPGALQSMHSTLKVLHAELDTSCSSDAPDGVSKKVEKQHQDASSVSTTKKEDDQIDELVENLTLMTERIALLTAANEAAQAEAAHGRSAIENLAEALQAQQVREDELQFKLQETENECKQLLTALHAVEKDQQMWESQVNAKITDLQRQLETFLNRPPPPPSAVDESSAQNQHHHHVIAPGLSALLDGLDVVLEDAAAMEQRLKSLEAAAAVTAENRTAHTQQQWSKLTAGALRGRAVAAVRAESRREIARGEAVVAQQAQQIDALTGKVVELETERSELQQRLHSVRQLHEQQLHQSAEFYAVQLAALTADVEAHRQEAESQARTREESVDKYEAARRAVARLKIERDSLHAEFMKYRDVKTAEVQLLEQRLGIFSAQLSPSFAKDDVDVNAAREMEFSSTSDVKIASAAGQIAAICRADGVAAALREAALERGHRTQLQQALEAAQHAEKRASTEKRAAEMEVTALQQRLQEHERQIETLKAEFEKVIEVSKQQQEESGVEIERLVRQIQQMTREKRAAEEQQQREVCAARGAAMHALTERVVRAEREMQHLGDDLDEAAAVRENGGVLN